MKVIINILFVLLLALPAFALPSAEEKRLDAMFELLAQDSDMVFIRNGEEYGAAEAVAHLQRKLTFAARFLDTAEEFIDRAATKSSVSGEPYLIRSKIDNSTVGAAPYLKNLLKKVDEGIKGRQAVFAYQALLVDKMYVMTTWNKGNMLQRCADTKILAL